MKTNVFSNWQDSANNSWGMNENCIKKNGVLYFYIVTEQKEYLENHIDEIDDWCERTIGEIPHTIKFQEDWDEYDGEFGYYCQCYFDRDFVVSPNVDTDEGLMDIYHKEGYDFSVGVKKYLNNGKKVEFYTIDSDWKPKFFIGVSSKDGSVITDDIIKSHVEIFFE